MDFDDHRSPRSDVCILLLHHNIGDALVLCVSCVQIECILQIKLYIGFVRVIYEQGDIKCGNRGTGFLDSEGSH